MSKSLMSIKKLGIRGNITLDRVTFMACWSVLSNTYVFVPVYICGFAKIFPNLFWVFSSLFIYPVLWINICGQDIRSCCSLSGWTRPMQKGRKWLKWSMEIVRLVAVLVKNGLRILNRKNQAAVDHNKLQLINWKVLWMIIFNVGIMERNMVSSIHFL